MVLQSICNSLILILGWYLPSYSSGIYVFFGILLWFYQILSRSLSNLYHMIYILGLILICLKAYLLFYVFREIDTYKILYDFVSFSQPTQIKTDPFIHLAPDIAVVILSLLGNWLNSKINPERLEKATKVIAAIILILTGTSMLSIFHMFYLISFMLQVFLVSFCYKNNIQMISSLTSFFAMMQLAYPYTTEFLKFSSETEKILEACGFLKFPDSGLIELFSIALVHSFYSYIAYASAHFRDFSFMNDSLRTPLEPGSAQSRSETILNLKFIFFYIIVLCLLWLWIFLYPGPAGLLIISWIFFSIVSKSAEALKTFTRCILLPILAISFLGFYISSLLQTNQYADESYGIYTFTYIRIETGFVTTTISTVCAIYHYTKDMSSILYFPRNLYGRICASAFKRIYIFSLVVLFLIGLSDISVLYSVLMLICIVFMINPKVIKTHWIWLLGYNMSMLYLRYIYRVLAGLFEDETSQYVLKIIGLNIKKGTENSLLSYDYLIWILLISVSLQHFANQIKIKEERRRQEHILIKPFVIAYYYLLKIEIYVMYAIILALIFLSDTNILNFACTGRPLTNMGCTFNDFAFKHHIGNVMPLETQGPRRVMTLARPVAGVAAISRNQTGTSPCTLTNKPVPPPLLSRVRERRTTSSSAPPQETTEQLEPNASSTRAQHNP